MPDHQPSRSIGSTTELSGLHLSRPHAAVVLAVSGGRHKTSLTVRQKWIAWDGRLGRSERLSHSRIQFAKFWARGQGAYPHAVDPNIVLDRSSAYFLHSTCSTTISSRCSLTGLIDVAGEPTQSWSRYPHHAFAARPSSRIANVFRSHTSDAPWASTAPK